MCRHMSYMMGGAVGEVALLAEGVPTEGGSLASPAAKTPGHREVEG